MKYSIAIFDLDGTILDTLDDLADSTNYVLTKAGMPTRTRDEVRRFVGNGIHKLIERAVPANTSDEQIESVFEAFKEHYKSHSAIHTRPYDGTIELLTALRNGGCKTAVVSNKADFAVKDLCEQYFPHMFDIAVGERENVRRKPAPDAVNAILDTLNISRENAIYIGDSDVDIETAKNCGMDCISVTWGFRDREFLLEHGAQKLISEPDEIRKLILE
ncbi:MAG: HAD family hydrolase [Clostridiales bacterium]|nr:HAD family hydrolase [Clostridiales bacterium]